MKIKFNKTLPKNIKKITIRCIKGDKKFTSCIECDKFRKYKKI